MLLRELSRAAVALMVTVVALPSPAANPSQTNAGDISHGRYLTIIGGCNDCHTEGYAESGGKVPQKDWLQGSVLGHRGPWGTTYAVNLRAKLATMSEAEWITYAQTLKTRPPMPWVHVEPMVDRRLARAVSVCPGPRPGRCVGTRLPRAGQGAQAAVRRLETATATEVRGASAAHNYVFDSRRAVTAGGRRHIDGGHDERHAAQGRLLLRRHSEHARARAKIMAGLAAAGVNLLAFSGFPNGRRTQLDLMPEDSAKLKSAAKAMGLKLSARKTGFLFAGDDRVGAMTGILDKLAAARINVTAIDAVGSGDGPLRRDLLGEAGERGQGRKAARREVARAGIARRSRTGVNPSPG
jgi:hypothetical protein